MSIANSHSVTRTVRKQYESFPYPHRDPAEDAERLLGTYMDALPTVSHYLFQGKLDVTKSLRVLIAGGGTGDATVYLGRQLRDTRAEVVYVDLSEQSQQIARARARQHGIEDRIKWVRGSLLELPNLGLGQFDYINCSGVLHHLADPVAGLAALRGVLSDRGGMGIMVYARYGRSGVYQMQNLMRMLNGGEPDPRVCIDRTKLVLDRLPPSNWVNHNKTRFQFDLKSDAGIYDLYLHSNDRAYSVPELYEWLATAGLRPVEFIPEFRHLYNADMAFCTPDSRALLEGLSLPEKQAVAELFWGNIIKHEVWVSPHEDSQADPGNPDNIPFFTVSGEREKLHPGMLNTPTGEIFTHKLARTDGMTAQLSVEMTPETKRLIQLLDGRRTIGEIVRGTLNVSNLPGGAQAVWNLWHSLYQVLGGYDMILLRHKYTPKLPTC